MTVDGEALRDGLRRDAEVVAVDRDDAAARLIEREVFNVHLRIVSFYSRTWRGRDLRRNRRFHGRDARRVIAEGRGGRCDLRLDVDGEAFADARASRRGHHRDVVRVVRHLL